MHHHHPAIYMEATRNRSHPATMHLFRDVLAPAIFSDNPRPILDLCFAQRLLARNRVCPACFLNMEIVPDRRAQTLIPIIERVVRHGSIIHSDQWAAYRQLSANVNYTYATVNHSVNFVDPVTGVHTQAIESYWAKAKNKFKAMKGVATPQLSGYLRYPVAKFFSPKSSDRVII